MSVDAALPPSKGERIEEMGVWAENLFLDALAAYLGRPRQSIEAGSHLHDDLGLDRADMAFIVLRLERFVRREFPMPLLDIAETVDELSRLVAAWAALREKHLP